MSAKLGDFHTLLTDQVRRRTGEIAAAVQAGIASTKVTNGTGPQADQASASEAVLILKRAIEEGADHRCGALRIAEGSTV